MILAREFKALARRRNAFMREIIDALLSCYHRALIIPSMSAGRCSIRQSSEPSAFRLATTVATEIPIRGSIKPRSTAEPSKIGERMLADRAGAIPFHPTTELRAVLYCAP
jgi:hypothetical protein